MSQIKFHAQYKKQPVEVMAGWDRPLQEFFLTLFDRDNEAVWSTMGEIIPPQTPDEVVEFLSRFQIDPPDGFADRLSRKEGNVIHVHHPETGWVQL